VKLILGIAAHELVTCYSEFISGKTSTTQEKKERASSGLHQKSRTLQQEKEHSNINLQTLA
jgi:hypothetical protein